MDVYAFQAKWRAAQGTERALAQAHFLGLCALVGLPDHALGDGVAFERTVAKAGGGTGFADAWVRGRFAMEYKGRGAVLEYRAVGDGGTWPHETPNKFGDFVHQGVQSDPRERQTIIGGPYGVL